MPTKNKYRNIKTELDGIKFDSLKEARRYSELKILERAGEIKELELQPKYELLPKQEGERAVVYKADFMYFDFQVQGFVVEDVKGMKTRDYIIKRKLFKSKYPQYTFKEV